MTYADQLDFVMDVADSMFGEAAERLEDFQHASRANTDKDIFMRQIMRDFIEREKGLLKEQNKRPNVNDMATPGVIGVGE